jgi:hypothetical protein
VKRFTGEERFWLVAVAAPFGLLVATGFIYRPSYADSMVYARNRRKEIRSTSSTHCGQTCSTNATREY